MSGQAKCNQYKESACLDNSGVLVSGTVDKLY